MWCNKILETQNLQKYETFFEGRSEQQKDCSIHTDRSTYGNVNRCKVSHGHIKIHDSFYFMWFLIWIV